MAWELSEWDTRENVGNWNSGLKTLPRHDNGPRNRAPLSPQPHRSASRDRWDLENEKVLSDCRYRSAPHSRPQFCRSGHWNSGLKTVDDAEYRPRGRIAEISDHCGHGDVSDWEYTGTLHKTLHVDTPKRQTESWFTENAKVLDADEAHLRTAWDVHGLSPCQSPYRRLPTETMPVNEWDPVHKVLPANRMRRFLTNNRTCDPYRDPNVPISQLPNDLTWDKENFKVLNDKKPRLNPQMDDWGAGYKIVPEENPLARERHFNRVPHPYTWLDENGKTLPGKARKNDIYKFVVENTGWDSALYKTFGPEELSPSMYGRRARINYAANNDWAVEGKVLPPNERYPRRRQFENYGTGWDSGLKTLPFTQSYVRHPARTHSGADGYWDLHNGKTLNWEEQTAASHVGENTRRIAKQRHMDMLQFEQRFSQRDDRCLC